MHGPGFLIPGFPLPLGIRQATAGAPPIVPDYGNPGGTGDRTGIITVAWDGTNTSGFNPDQLVDGTQNDEFWWTAGQTNKILKFDFGVGASKVINEFKWYQSSLASHGGSNRFEGSDDNSNWTTFPETFTLGSAGATHTVSITNSTGYRYYRITVPGATSATPYLREIEFKIG